MQVQEAPQDSQDLREMPASRVHPVQTGVQVPTGAQDLQDHKEREEHPESEALTDPLEHPDLTVRSLPFEKAIFGDYQA